MRRLSNLKGLSVIASKDGVNLGTVNEVVVDLAEGSLEGIIVQSGSIEKGIEARDIDVIGDDAIMVSEASDARPLSEVSALADRRSGKEKRRLAVLTTSGKKLGQVGEIYIDPKAGTVTRFEISGGSLRDLTDGTLSFPVVEGMMHGRDVLLVPDEIIARIKTGEGGLRGTWAKVSEQLREDYSSASERAEVLYKESAEHVRRAVEQARDTSREVSEQVSERIKEAKEKTAKKAEAEEPPAQEAGTEEAESSAAEEEDVDTEVQELEQEQAESDPVPEAEVTEGTREQDEADDDEE